MNDPRSKTKHIYKVCEQLGEHFTSVIILASGNAEDGSGATCMFKAQTGNVHCHEGVVREWLREQEGHQLGFHMEGGRRTFIEIEGDENDSE